MHNDNSKLKIHKKKILVTGGGTGGHIVPLMVVVSELKKHKVDILYVGSGKDEERKAASDQGIKYKSVFSGKWRRYYSWQNIADILKVVIGFIQSLFIILSFRPNVVFAKGGYVTVPVILAAWILAKPIITHETDVIIGLANRIGAKFAKKICVSYPVKYYKALSLHKVIYTGQPIDTHIALRSHSGQAYRISHISKNHKQLAISNKPVILITGGSQGARFINQTIAVILPKLTQKYNIIHLSGKIDYKWLSKNRFDNYQLYDYTDKFTELMSSADLVISRAGGTIMNIAALSKPSIIIPLPSAASNHQEANAKVLESNNAAIILREKNLTPDNLLEIINRTMEDRKLRGDLSKQISQFSQPDAAKVIADVILSTSALRHEVKNS